MLDCTHAGSSPHLGILDSCFFVGGSASCGASEQASSGTAIIETQHYSNHGFVSGSVQNNMIQAALSAFGTQQNAVVGHIDKAKLKRKSACTLVGWGCIWTAPATSGDGAAGRHRGATRRRKGCPQGGRQMRGRLVGSQDLLAPNDGGGGGAVDLGWVNTSAGELQCRRENSTALQIRPRASCH